MSAEVHVQLFIELILGKLFFLSFRQIFDNVYTFTADEFHRYRRLARLLLTTILRGRNLLVSCRGGVRFWYWQLMECCLGLDSVNRRVGT